MRKDIFLLEVEDIQQALDGVLRAIFLDFESDGGAALDLAQFGLDGMQKVLGFFLVDIEVAVSRHPEKVRSLDAHPVKQGSRRDAG